MNHRKATIKILDEVNAVIIGLSSEHHNYLYNEFKYKVPNAFFSPKVKLGIWDGYIRFYKNTGKTLVYLLPKIIKILKDYGYKITLMDLRTNIPMELPQIDKDYFKHILDPDTDLPIELRYYQVDAINALMKFEKGLIIAGTGSGKTLISAVICDIFGKLGCKSITIVPSQDLIDPTKDQFELCEMDVGEYSGGLKDLDHQHIVSTWQALQNNTPIIKQFEMVLVDECHNCKSTILNELLMKHGGKLLYRYGVTATIPKVRLEQINIFAALGDPQYEIPAHKLIEEGFLAKPKIDILQLKVNLKREFEEFKKLALETKTYTQFKNSYFADYDSEKRFLEGNKSRNSFISEYIQILSEKNKGNVFCLVSSKKVGRSLEKLIPDSTFVCGDDKKKIRKEIYNLFKNNNNIIVIATVHVAGVGINIKRIFNLVYIDIGKSFIRVIQTIGRALRKADDKETVHITDICSDLKHSKRHLTIRTKYYKEAQYKFKKQILDI